jgi:hypothetical protein
MKWAKGDAYNYTVTTTTEMNGSKIPINMTYGLKVDKVTNGVADVTMSMTSPLAKDPMTVKAKMDGRGEVGEKGVTSSMGIPRLPEKAIAVGGTWKSTQTTTQNGMTMKVDTTYTLKGIETVDKVSCAVIDVKATGSGAFATSSTGKMYVVVSSGQLFKATLNSTMTMTSNGKSQQFKMTTVIARK